MRLDHLAIVAASLEDGVAWAEDRLGVVLGAGGKHPRYGTHNRLLGLEDGLYLEVIAPDPDGASKGPRWFGLDHVESPPRLGNWICEPSDFEGALRHGMQSVPMARGNLRWDMGVPPNGSLPLGGAYPTVLRWHTDTPPGKSLPQSGCAMLKLTVQHPDAVAIERDVGVGLDPRVRFVESADIRLSATFKTPKGEVTL